jgi:hypothetical protein
MHVLTLRRMIKDRGIDALVNECLIGPVLSMGATFIAYACALLAYLYLIFTSPAYNQDGSYTPVVVAFSFLIGLQNIRCDGLGSGGSYACSSGSLSPHGGCVPSRAAGYPRVKF